MQILITIIIGYLLGSIPTAYLLLKRRGLDVTREGSGNVGAMNTFDITGSKNTGIFVFLIDALKGLLSVYIPLLIFPINFLFPALGLIFAVLAHCFNPWIGFKGGRGLATSLGGAILIVPFMAVIWITSWILIYLIKRDIIAGNIFATVMVFPVVAVFSATAFRFTFPTPDSLSTMILFVVTILILIFVKHIDPLLDLINKRKITEDKDDK